MKLSRDAENMLEQMWLSSDEKAISARSSILAELVEKGFVLAHEDGDYNNLATLTQKGRAHLQLT